MPELGEESLPWPSETGHLLQGLVKAFPSSQTWSHELYRAGRVENPAGRPEMQTKIQACEAHVVRPNSRHRSSRRQAERGGDRGQR